MIIVLMPKSTCASRSAAIKERFRLYVEDAVRSLFPGEDFRVEWGRIEFMPPGLGPYLTPGVGCPAPAEITAGREMLGLSIQEAARLVDVPVDEWAQWESGRLLKMHPAIWAAFVDLASEKPEDRERGNEAKALRVKHGLTQTEAGRLAGVTVQTWCAWERGRKAMPRTRMDAFLYNLERRT